MAQSPEPSDPSSPAEDLYAQYLAQRAAPDCMDIESWCARHDAHGDALRRLHGQYAQWKSIFDRLADSARQGQEEKRFADELKKHHGEGVDPAISLDGCRPSEESGPSSELLRRLRTHAPSNSRYRLLGEVGRGGMGAVIRVWDEDLHRTLAMKVVLGTEDKSTRSATPPVDSRTLGRFLEEAQITGQLDHPGIVPVHELGLGSGGQVYFTMRLVRGEDLRNIYRHVESGHEDWTAMRALGVMLKVCEAMAYAHSKGVIHRDLKPANIMVGRYGEVYVMDWGLARVAGQADLHDLRLRDQFDSSASQSVRTARGDERADSPDSPLVTMDGDVMGTPAYMPPEQAQGEIGKLGPHSDVYAVGAMLYHLLLVKHIEMPYVARGVRLSQTQVLILVQEGAPRAISDFDRTIPAPLVAIVEKAMSREISRRYPDMEALASDLRAYIEGRVVKAHETGSWAEAKQWVKRNKPLAAAAAAAVLALLGGIAFSWHFALDADAERSKAEDAARVAEGERAKTSAVNAELRLQSREQQLRGMIQEVARFREQCRTTYGLERLGKPAYQWWLGEANRLLDGQAEDLLHGKEWRPGRKDVQAKIAELRTQALEYKASDRVWDESSHPARLRIRALECELEEELLNIKERLEKEQPANSSLATRLATEESAVRARFEEQFALLREQAKVRRTWRFSDSQLEWWHAQLTALDSDLTWLSKMREVVVASTETVDARARWSEAVESIARSPKYAGQLWPGGDRLTPQAGLLPLGENPATGLWEFVHLQTGAEPATGADGRVLRDAEGRLSMTPGAGMVLVLLPGGQVPKADSEEQCQEEWIPNVALSPFFLSKYELTAEQWDRLSLGPPRHYTHSKTMTPANNISWDDIAALWLRELGWCCLPSEAQWEYGCRAGTATRWWTGNAPQSLKGAENLDHDNVYWDGDDSNNTDILPVGTLKPNAFGLHDVHGNVEEFCGDTWATNIPARAIDGLRDDGVHGYNVFRVRRGWFYFGSPVDAYSSSRVGRIADDRTPHAGLRPARRITP